MIDIKQHYWAYKIQVQETMDTLSQVDGCDLLCEFGFRDWLARVVFSEESELKSATMRIKEALRRGDEKAYKVAVSEHQHLAIALCCEYVRHYAKPYREILGNKTDALLVEEKGWGWYKFFDRIALFPFFRDVIGKSGLPIPVRIIPRYCKEFCHERNVIYLDTDEINLAKKIGKMFAKDVIRLKDGNGLCKMYESEGKVKAAHIVKFNKEGLKDWTLPLFGGDYED